MSFLMEHTVLFGGFDLFTIICLVVCAAVVIYCVTKERKLKKRRKNLQEAVSSRQTVEETEKNV